MIRLSKIAELVVLVALILLALIIFLAALWTGDASAIVGGALAELAVLAALTCSIW